MKERKINRKTFEFFGLDLFFDIPERVKIGKIKYENLQILNQQALVLERPTRFYFGNNQRISGVIDFGL